jgi:hypothetical protein
LLLIAGAGGPYVKAIILFFLLVAAGCIQTVVCQSGPQEDQRIEKVYLARDDGNGKAGDQVTEFYTGDIPIYCVVLLNAAPKTVVKMNFVAVSVAGVKPDTRVVSSSYTTKEGQNRVNFTGRPEDKWTPGKYRVDIFLDGKMANSVEFLIKGTGDTKPGGSYLQPPAKRTYSRKMIH